MCVRWVTDTKGQKIAGGTIVAQTHLSMSWPSNHLCRVESCFHQSPSFRISSLNAIEKMQGCILFLPVFPSIYSSTQWQVWCTKVGSYSTHLLPMCCWVTHTFSVTKRNKYLFSPWQFHRVVATEEKTTEIPSWFSHRNIIVSVWASTTKRDN